jgi:DNA primase
MLSVVPYAREGKDTRTMREDLEQLKQRIPLLQYLQQRNWTGNRVGAREEFVGLCPLRRETRPSFYVNVRKNLFYCHGCGRGGDLIRFIELSQGLSFRQSIAFLQQQISASDHDAVLEKTAAFYQLQLHRHPQAIRYLQQRGLHDPALIEELGIGYAPGGNLRRHLAAQGYPLDLLLTTGLINRHGRDTFCRRVIFPCRQHGQIVNLYGRSIGTAFPHRLLPRSKGGLFAWSTVGQFSAVILVEGLFDLAALWQSGFRNTTCALGTHLTPAQFGQLSDRPGRSVYLVLDQDENQAGQQAAQQLARSLENAGVAARIVHLPPSHDPNSYFLAGATAADFAACLQGAQPC